MSDCNSNIFNNGSFLLSSLTLILAFLGLMIRYCLRSKCVDVRFCGIRCLRDVNAEENELIYRNEHNILNEEKV